MQPKLKKLSAINASLGALVWLTLWLAPRLGAHTEHDVARIMILAPLILVPLTLRIEHRPTSHPLEKRLWQFIVYTQTPFAALAVASFFCPKGIYALMIVPWFILTGAIALTGVINLWRDRGKHLHETCIDAGRIYLPGGAVWWIAYQAGFPLLDFPLLIVLLTAMHFHFAGYMAPWLSGQAARGWIWLRGQTGNLWKALLIGTIMGMPMIAIGIQASKVIELIFVGIFTTSLIIVSLLNLSLLNKLWTHSKLATLGLTISGVSIFLTMFSALAFVARHLTDVFSLTIAEMVLIHGWANGLGFALCGALAWQVLPSAHLSDQVSTEEDAPKSIS